LFELQVWFNEITVQAADGSEIPLGAFIAGGKRWWMAFYLGDPRTKGFGMYPAWDEGPAPFDLVSPQILQIIKDGM
jgi:hypothetical protein